MLGFQCFEIILDRITMMIHSAPQMTNRTASNSSRRFSSKPGTRVIMCGDHPWAGECGEYIGDEKTPWGMKPKIMLDNGTECFAHSIGECKVLPQ